MQTIVIGSGNVARHLSSRLIDQGDDVVIVDNDCAALEAITLDCIKIRGVPFDRDVLQTAGAETADVLIAVSREDNVNLMTAQVAREFYNMEHVYARIANPENRETFESLGIRTVCATSLVVDLILSELSQENFFGNVSMFGNPLRFTSVQVAKGLEGTPMSRLEPDAGQMVFGVLRGHRLLLYDPELRVQEGDQIVICTHQ